MRLKPLPPPRAYVRACIRKSNFRSFRAECASMFLEPQRVAAATRSLLFGLPMRTFLRYLIVTNGTQRLPFRHFYGDKQVLRVVLGDGDRTALCSDLDAALRLHHGDRTAW